MKPVRSMPNLPEVPKEPLTLKVACTEAWQKSDETVTNGGRILFHAILKALKDGNGLLIGRNGTIELTTILQAHHQPTLVDLNRMAILERNAGVFPQKAESLASWIVEYTNAVEAADVMAAGWYKPLAAPEWKLLDTLNSTSQRIPLRSLEPYYCEGADQWTRALEGQKVCVVSSFTETMKWQVGIAKAIWLDDHSTLLPDNVQWSFVRSYYSPVLAKGKCEWPDGIQSWKDAVTYMEEEIEKTGARIVLLGCGGLAMPLAYRLKKKGVIAIVLGGSIQVLFGIKGKRWQTHPVISGFWNTMWRSPSPAEVPGGAAEIEGGCYW